MAIGSGTTSSGIHYLVPSDQPDLAGITQQIANDVDGYVVQALSSLTVTTFQAIPNATPTTVTGWAQKQTAINMGSYSAGVRTISIPGHYVITAQITWPSGSSTGSRSVGILINGTQISASPTSPDSARVISCATSVPYQLAAGDTVAITAFQSSGGNLSLFNNGAGADIGYNTWQIMKVA